MFLKLLKYDLKSMAKTMVPLWVVGILISVIFGTWIHISGISEYISAGIVHDANGYGYGFDILLLMLIAIFISTLVLNIIIILQRFWNGLLKEEGYLMFTLPLSQRKLILSKVASAVIISIGSMLIAILASIIIGGSGLTLVDQTEWNFILEMIRYFISNVSILNVVYTIIYLLLTLINSIYKIYVSMAIGHLSNWNRFLCTLIAYILISVILSFVEAMIYEPIEVYLSYSMSMIVSMGILAVEIIVYHVVTELILTYRLNLE